jgi:5,10-methylenetetrahydromethanopterin reductase
MPAHEIGLTFRSELDESRIGRIAGAANAFDFATLGVWDDLGDPAPWPMLAALAGERGNARVGPSCLALPKYAALDGIVSELTRLEQLRPGRIFLGLAGGAWLDKIGLERATPERMREAVAALRYLIERRTGGFDGRHYKLAPGFRVNYPTPRELPPLLIGAWGKRMLALAGQIAGEVKLGGSANAALSPLVRECVAGGAEQAGRKVEEVGIVLGAVTVVDEDRDAALRRLRPRAAVYIDAVAGNDPTVVRDFPEELAAIRAAVQRSDIDVAARSLPDALLRRFAFGGSPADVIAQVEEAFNAGVRRVEFGSPHGLDEVDGIELLGRRVLPYFTSS